MQMTRAWSVLALALASGAVAAPNPPPDVATTPALDLVKLERARDRRPDDVQRRNDLALAYYLIGRTAIDEGDFETAAQEFARSETEWNESQRLEGRSAMPHTFIGMMRAYQGEIDDSVRRMFAARLVEPSDGLTYMNIAATLTYAGGDTHEIERWLARGSTMGARPALVEFRRCILRWRDGDTEAAAHSFYRAIAMDPDLGRYWNEAPVPRPIKTFDDLTRYCCGSPACGPYLKISCATAREDVEKLDLPAERALRELRREMARTRELNAAGPERRDLQLRPRSEADPALEPEAEPAPTGSER
jgi:tetratricopeptide (TPR) repeat protein